MTAPAPLKFPLDWEFRLIAESARLPEVRAAAAAAMRRCDPACRLDVGAASAGNRYTALRAVCRVESRESLNRLSAELAALPGVKMLL